MNNNNIADVQFLRDQLKALQTAIERASGELLEAEASARGAFASGSPEATHEAMLAAQQAKDRLAGLQQQAQAAEAQLRGVLEPEIDQWADSCAEDAGNWASRTAFLTAELADALAKLEHVLDALGALPQERTAILKRQQEAWQAIAGEVPEISLEQPDAPSLTMPDIRPAMAGLQKLADDYCTATALRPSLAEFLLMPR